MGQQRHGRAEAYLSIPLRDLPIDQQPDANDQTAEDAHDSRGEEDVRRFHAQVLGEVLDNRAHAIAKLDEEVVGVLSLSFDIDDIVEDESDGRDAQREGETRQDEQGERGEAMGGC